MAEASAIYSIIFNNEDPTCRPYVGTRNNVPVVTFTSFSLRRKFKSTGEVIYCDWFESHRVAVFYTSFEDDEPTFLKIYDDESTEEISEGDPDYELLLHDCPDLINCGPSMTFLDVVEKHPPPSRSSTPEIIPVRLATPDSQPSKKQRRLIFENSTLSSIQDG
jgi:hypothetical protein